MLMSVQFPPGLTRFSRIVQLKFFPFHLKQQLRNMFEAYLTKLVIAVISVKENYYEKLLERLV